jgi:hypothetical protein
MTKRRDPMTFADAVTRIARDMTWAWIAELLGKSESHVRRAGDPDGKYQFSLEQAYVIDSEYILATGDVPPLLGVYRRRLEQLIAQTEGRRAEARPLQTCAGAMELLGKLTGDLARALSDGGITRTEAMSLSSGIETLHKQLDRLLAEVIALRGEGDGSREDGVARFPGPDQLSLLSRARTSQV